MKRRGWDTEKAKVLYDQNLSDAEIAGRVRTTASAVACWRRGLGLPANPGQRPPPQEEAAPVPSPPSTPPPRPLVLPAKGVPATNQRSVCGGERRKEWSGRSPRRQAEAEQRGISSDEGPVELSVELDGCSFALRAPDLEGAAWIHAYAGRLLEDMSQIAVKLKEGTCDA